MKSSISIWRLVAHAALNTTLFLLILAAGVGLLLQMRGDLSTHLPFRIGWVIVGCGMLGALNRSIDPRGKERPLAPLDHLIPIFGVVATGPFTWLWLNDFLGLFDRLWTNWLGYDWVVVAAVLSSIGLAGLAILVLIRVFRINPIIRLKTDPLPQPTWAARAVLAVEFSICAIPAAIWLNATW